MGRGVGNYNPFIDHAARRYCPSMDSLVDGGHCRRDYWVMPNPIILQPSLVVEDEGRKVLARLNDEDFVLYDREDLHFWRGSVHRKAVIPNMQGRIGERVGPMLLGNLVDRVVRKARKDKYRKSRGRVLLEERERDGRPYRKHTVEWSDPYKLSFDRRSTFTLMMKAKDGERRFLYKDDENEGFDMCEIDGIAKVSVVSGQRKKNYVIVTEIKTSQGNTIYPNHLIEDNRRRKRRNRKKKSSSLEERLFRPLRSLFPGCNIVYVYMGYQKSLFTEGSPHPRLKGNGVKTVETLAQSGVQGIFMPLPQTINCNSLAEMFYQQLVKWRQGLPEEYHL